MQQKVSAFQPPLGEVLGKVLHQRRESFSAGVLGMVLHLVLFPEPWSKFLYLCSTPEKARSIRLNRFPNYGFATHYFHIIRADFFFEKKMKQTKNNLLCYID